MDPHGATARRFPLVARVRPPCLPLHRRVDKLTELADAAEAQAYQGQASSVFNQAALLASDLDLPELASQWCHQHAAAYLQHTPLAGMDAIRALEPIVNLARLHIRAGRTNQGHQLLLTLYDAVTAATTGTFEGIHVPADLTATDADRDEVRQWLWRVVIADGTRALTTAGRWPDALAHLEKHRGVGAHMLDGRQVAVLARATTGDHRGAQQLLSDTIPGEPWENAVTACLTALCHPAAHRLAANELDVLTGYFPRLEIRADLAVFHTRLLLSAIDIDRGASHPGIRTEASALADRIADARDGYAAREVLTHHGCTSILTERQTRILEDTVEICALGHRAIPHNLRRRLSSALLTSEAVIVRTLSAHFHR
ncbi:hypothetical protein ACFVH7_29615 [Kitasatospora indigofera]|uniref:hypothetical protein n=1 Tax=Kitasatospora indigofera TaxID=67307 RepID=UPI003640BB05